MEDSINALELLDTINERKQYEQTLSAYKREKPYQSIYRDKTAETYFYHKGQKAGAVFGPGQSIKPDATQWLKKHVADPGLSDPKEFHYDDPLERKPPVPKQDDKPICGLKSDVNFVEENRKRAKLMIPKCTYKVEVDWTERAEFGERPAYLDKVEQEVRQEQYELRELETSQRALCGKAKARGKAQKLSDEERQELLQGLKKNWQDLNFEYTTTTKSIVETFGQKERKQFLEKRLAEIEADIILLEGGDVYVK